MTSQEKKTDSTPTVPAKRKYRFGFHLPINEAQKNYFYVTAFAILTIFLSRFLVDGPPVAFTFLVGAALGLFFIGDESRGWRAMPLIIVIILSYFLFAPLLIPINYRTNTQVLRTHHFEPMTIIVAIAVLIYLAAQYRYYSLTKRIFPNENIGLNQEKKPKYFRNIPLLEGPEITRMVIIAVVCVICAELIWFFANELYFEPSISELIREAGSVGMETSFYADSVSTWLSRLILVVAFFVCVVLATHSIFRVWRIQQITPLQGEAILADTGWSANHKEHRRIELWRAWAKEKAKRRKK